MHLLYRDESGHSHDPNSDFFVLAGFSVFERQTHWLEAQIDLVAARFSSISPREIEFHGNPMRSGSGTWRGVSPNDRVQAVVDILSQLADKQLQLKVYACVIEKKLFSPNDILSRSFEEVASCFDGYLKTPYKKKNPQRGLVILDKSSYEEKIQILSHVFKLVGHANGQLRKLCRSPAFSGFKGIAPDSDGGFDRLLNLSSLSVRRPAWLRPHKALLCPVWHRASLGSALSCLAGDRSVSGVPPLPRQV
ncbi:DUF3800 domain-containing protein [Rhizobium daejeonense]|uniref:DUF3800 domain-containing protein n=1 Tax=Rhizobium daejeonense TaxID=240521 RepID=UPI00197EEE35|nr:DUF3800 domain-containing protein [Rhizobium daejeonense]